MIDQLTIEKILDAANIVDVVSEFVTLRRRGVNYVGLCPFHNEIQEWIGYVGIEYIEGSFYNVMGLPVQRVYSALKEFVGLE